MSERVWVQCSYNIVYSGATSDHWNHLLKGLGFHMYEISFKIKSKLASFTAKQ